MQTKKTKCYANNEGASKSCPNFYRLFNIPIHKVFLIYFVLCISTFSPFSFSQGPGVATNPSPADSSTSVFWFDKNISWINPPSATDIKINVGIHPNYLTELYAGPVISSFVLPSPLDIRRSYYWRIDEVDNSGITIGNTWLFTTSVVLYPVFIDSFNLGMSNWNTVNLLDSCDWEWKNFAGTNYDLPPTSKTYGIVFEKANCQNLRSVNILELINPPSLAGYTRWGIGWDNDLVLSINDTAYVEISKDGGSTWDKVWARYGRNQRKSQENIWFSQFGLNWNIEVRFYASFENDSSWWAIDNFYVDATSLASFLQIPPRNLEYNLNIGDSLNVQLLWDEGFGPPSIDRYRVQRKFGDSLDQYSYFTIGETDLNSLSFIDSRIDSNIVYTYKVSLCEGPIHGIESSPLTILTLPIPVELVSFYSSIQNGLTFLNWVTATELNNFGFYIEKSLDQENWSNIGFVEGKGTTTEINHYFFIDSSSIQVRQFYRLKQMDYNGNFNYSDIISSSNDIPSEYNIIYCYPNPFNNSTTIQFILGNDEAIELLIYNTLGEIVNRIFEGTLEKQKLYTFNFKADGLSSGVYVCCLKQGRKVYKNKMILLK